MSKSPNKFQAPVLQFLDTLSNSDKLKCDHKSLEAAKMLVQFSEALDEIDDIEIKIQCDTPYIDGYMPLLHCAVLLREEEAIKILINANSIYKTQTETLYTPLILATLNKDIDTVKFILEIAKTEGDMSILENKDAQMGKTPYLHAITFQDVSYDQIDDDIMREHKEGYDIARELIKYGANIEAQDHYLPIEHSITHREYSANAAFFSKFLKMVYVTDQLLDSQSYEAIDKNTLGLVKMGIRLAEQDQDIIIQRICNSIQSYDEGDKESLIANLKHNIAKAQSEQQYNHAFESPCDFTFILNHTFQVFAQATDIGCAGDTDSVFDT